MDFTKLKQKPKNAIINEITKINLFFVLGIKKSKTTPININNGGIYEIYLIVIKPTKIIILI